MKNPFELSDKRILITGASSGIGRQCAISCAAMGAQLIITGRNKERLEDCFQQLEGSGHRQYIADLTQKEDVDALIQSIEHPLNGVVNSAGIVKIAPIRFIPEAELREITEINYFAPVLLTNELMRKKKVIKKASFIFVSSLGSSEPYYGGGAYIGSKGALTAFSKVLALEGAKKGTRSNSISPASIKSDIYNQMEDLLSEEKMNKYAEKYPLGIGLPEDVANLVIYLLSDAARWVTGMDFKMDGGLLLNR